MDDYLKNYNKFKKNTEIITLFNIIDFIYNSSKFKILWGK